MLWSSINKNYKHFNKILLTYTSFELVTAETITLLQTLIYVILIAFTALFV